MYRLGECLAVMSQNDGCGHSLGSDGKCKPDGPVGTGVSQFAGHPVMGDQKPVVLPSK
jgi:hypothetical protein